MPRLAWSLVLILPALACSGRTTGSDGGATDGTDSAPGTDGTVGTTTASTTATATATATATDGGTETDGGDPRCGLDPDPGNCDGAFPRWYFDPETQRCETFTWGGCDGVVPFDDLATCQSGCEPCEAFLDEPDAGPPIAVTIRNDTAAPLYLDVAAPTDDGLDYFVTRHYEIFDGLNETLLPVRPTLCLSEFQCAVADQCLGCDPGPPYRPPPIKIDVGASFPAMAWDGLYWVESALAPECHDGTCAAPGEPLPCWRGNAFSGYALARAYATATVTCTDPGTCDCDAGFAGWCEMPIDAALEGDPVTAEGWFTYPGRDMVELVFQ